MVESPITPQETPTSPEVTPVNERVKENENILNTVELENANRTWNEQLPVADRQVEKKRRLNARFVELMIEQMSKGKGVDPELDAAIDHVSELLEKYEAVDENTLPPTEVAQAYNASELKDAPEISQKMIYDFKHKNETS